MNVRGFVFDLDGTLVDSKIDFASMRTQLKLAHEADVLEHIESLSPQARQRALEIIYQHELAGAKASLKIEGALEFVETAQAAGIPCAIFTRNARSLAQESLRTHGFNIDIIVAREDAPPKPKPDGLYKIARLLDVNFADMFFIGDYIYDLQAGLAAGVPTALFLPSPADFDITGADFTFNSYQQLNQKFFAKALS